MNKVILIGRLTKEPDIRLTPAGLKVAHYTLAVDRKFKKDGEPDADFIPCVAFGKPAEFTEKYLSKGAKIAICGRLQTRSYEDKYGQKKYVTEIIVDEQYFAESKRNADISQEQLKEIAEELKSADKNNSVEQINEVAEKENTKNESEIEQEVKEIAENLDDDDLPF